MKTLLLLIMLGLASCASQAPQKVVVSIAKQQLSLMYGTIRKIYPVSTSKYGTGFVKGSNKTPTGQFKVVEEIGEGLPLDTAYKGGVPLKCSRKGRDPIISRVIRIDGLDKANSNTKNRYVLLHGTPHVNQLGRIGSYGCVRMAPEDIADLCNRITVGIPLEIK